MSTKYKFIDKDGIYFVSFATISWVDVFTRPVYNEVFIDSVRYCQLNKGLCLHAWCLMSNHAHLVFSRSGQYSHSDILRDLKKFTSKKLIEAIENNPSESRKEWMLNIFSFLFKCNNNNKNYQFWKQDYHPVELNTKEKFTQRLLYLHENSVRSGLVWEPWHYKYSSAIDYYTNEKGLLKIELL